MGDDLAAELGAAVPPGVLALPDDDQRRLVELIRAAKRRQRVELDAAFDATVKHVPFPMRPLAKKMLRG